MANPDKAATVAELRDKFTNSSGAFLTEYRGLSVKALKDLRVSLGQNASYSVSKNTLTTIAAGEAGIDGLDEQLVGPTAIAFIDGDPVVVAKGLRDFARTNPLLVIKGGFLEGKVLGPDEVRKLADLESRETLLARVAGGMQGVLSQAISLISAPLSQAARLFGALQSAAEENPSLIGGRGTPTEDPATTTEAAPAPSPSAENDEASASEVAGSSAATDEASASEVAGSSAATDEASAATAPTITEAAPAAPTTEAAPAAPTTEAAPAAPTTEAAPAADNE